MFPLDDNAKKEYFRKIYFVISKMGKENPGVTIAPISSLRLLLIDDFGEDVQKDLVGAWNEKLKDTE